MEGGATGSQHCRANRRRTLACTQATSRRTRRQAEDSSTTSWRLRRSPRRSRSCSDSAEGPDVVPSRAYGFGEELGPFLINPGGKTLRLNPHAGNKLTNILFVDSPAGVGFSYTKTSNDLLTTGDIRTAHDKYAFVVHWLERFPEYRRHPLHLTGESYAGVKGFTVGDPITDFYYDLYLGYADYMLHNPLISLQLYNQIKIVCKNIIST